MNARILFFSLLIFCLSACREDEEAHICPSTIDPISESGVSQWVQNNTTPYEFELPSYAPNVQEPADNPTTVEGVALGRKLFYEKSLSGDNSLSCAGCHAQENAFSDLDQFSTGIDGIAGKRQGMALINLAFATDGFTWDGRAKSIEQQIIEPVANPIEMHETWSNAVEELSTHPDYPTEFEAAFGPGTITVDKTTKAIAQFLRSLISFQSVNDLARIPGTGVFFTEQQERGLLIFEGETGQCFHCHGGPNFTSGRFKNNALDYAETEQDFADFGLGGVTGDLSDYGKFKTPTLRNIALTPPYMHDGRFQTLEQVINFYSDSLRYSPNRDPVLTLEFPEGVKLNQEQKDDLLAYLHTLTDTSFVNNPAFSNPFE